MSTDALSALEQAERCKEKGNACFKKEKFNAAMEAYTEAITLCPNVPVYWTNRAICHRKRNEWESVASDCRNALELDKHSVKAHYYLGLALSETKKYDEAIQELEKALELGKMAKSTGYIVDDIWRDLSSAKFRSWEGRSSQKAEKHKNLRELCKSLIKRDLARRIELCDSKVGEYLKTEDTATDGDKDMDLSSNEQRKLELTQLQQVYDDHLLTLSEVFDRIADLDQPGEVPDYLCCHITMDVFRDPVITPSGVTYERTSLLEHLQKLGRFDPLTRATLHPEQIVPNLALKEAVNAYLVEHGWAYKM